jgi:hypothetical protein
MNAHIFEDQHGATRRAGLAAMQRGKKSRRIIRRAVIALAVLFALVNVMAALNPWLHRNDVQPVRTACARGMT